MTHRRLLALATLAAWLLTAPGCGDDQGPAARPPAKDPHDHGEHDHHDHHHDDHGHDHGDHGHGHDDHDHGHEGHGAEIILTPEAIRRAGIRVEPLRKHQLTGTFVAPARVSFNLEHMAHVGTPITGRVAEIKARVGDTATPGDVLLVIDSPELGEAQSDFIQKRTAVTTAGPTVELAASAHERARKLYEETRGISLTEVQRREAEWRAAQGELSSAKAAVTAAENRLHLLGMSQEAVEALARTTEIDPRSFVRAPIAGEVIQREVTLGELVGPDREALLVLADMSTLWVLAEVPEARLRHVAKGSKARITVAGHADEPIEGAVSYVSPEINPQTRSGSVRIEVPGKSSGLRPGMFARAEIQAAGGSDEPVLAVPEAAVQTLEGKSSVFVPVEGEPNTFAPRPVTLGDPVAGMRPVLEGLKEGDRVVVSNSFILKAELGKAGAGHEH